MKDNISEEIIRIKKLMNESEELDEGFMDSLKDLLSKLVGSEKVDKIKAKLKDLFGFTPEEKEDVLDVKKITTYDDDFYNKVLDCLGAPKTYSNLLFFYAWRQSEGGSAKNNPFNTTYRKGLDKSMYNNYNEVGVKDYMSEDIGVKATCSTIKLPRYSDIVSALKSGDAFNRIDTMTSLKKWGTGDLVKKVADGYREGNTPKPKQIA